MAATTDEYHRIADNSWRAEQPTLNGNVLGTDLRQDPIENDPAFATALLRGTLEAQREVGEWGDFGYCFVFWDCLKRILWKRYRVRWRNPAELNPESCFD